MSAIERVSRSSHQPLLIAGIVSATVLGLPWFFRGIMSSTFLPHAFCYAWDRRLIAVHLVTDALIWLSYVAIAGTLVYLVWKARDEIPFQWIFLAFGIFIIACGFTHLMEIVTLWKPVYWLSGYVKIITAAASVTTALALPRTLPRVIAMTKAAARTTRILAELETSNRELEAFSYSVSHDLRAPLRAIDGFSHAVLEGHADKMDDAGKADLQRVRAAARRMGVLIDDLLNMARMTRVEMSWQRVDLSSVAQDVMTQLQATAPERRSTFTVEPGLVIEGDPGLLRIALENLLGNAWKFTGARAQAVIEMGIEQQDGESVYFVRDNGAGFDMRYADKLFAPFQRLHDAGFPGTGIGLATVQRIIRRHGGRIWAEAAVDRGATFRFVLPRPFSSSRAESA